MVDSVSVVFEENSGIFGKLKVCGFPPVEIRSIVYGCSYSVKLRF